VYVALSRCRTLEGLVLRSPLPSGGLRTDEAILRFRDQARCNLPSEGRLQEARVRYQQGLLLDCFDFAPLRGPFHHLLRLLRENDGIDQAAGIDDLARRKRIFSEKVLDVGGKFQSQLKRLFAEDTLPEDDAAVLERIGKASVWFGEQLEAVFGDWVAHLQVDTDNAALRRQVEKARDRLRREVAVKKSGVQSCGGGFSPASYLRALSRADGDGDPGKKAPAPATENGASDLQHPELYRRLQEWRSRVAGKEGRPAYQVMHRRVLIQVAMGLPETVAQLRTIKGIGKKTAGKYGKDLLALVAAYRNLPPSKA
jgi:hypothetical protein